MEALDLFASLECYISEEADKGTYEGVRGSLSQLISQRGGIVHSLLVQDVDVVCPPFRVLRFESDAAER